MTLPSASPPDPAVRYVTGPEPGDRKELIRALARLLIQVRQRRRQAEGGDPGGEPNRNQDKEVPAA